MQDLKIDFGVENKSFFTFKIFDHIIFDIYKMEMVKEETTKVFQKDVCIATTTK